MLLRLGAKSVVSLFVLAGNHDHHLLMTKTTTTTNRRDKRYSLLGSKEEKKTCHQKKNRSRKKKARETKGRQIELELESRTVCARNEKEFDPTKYHFFFLPFHCRVNDSFFFFNRKSSQEEIRDAKDIFPPKHYCSFVCSVYFVVFF